MPEQRLMIGREQELDAFAAACASLRDGRGGCVLVTGEAGIGKTLLATQALAHARLTTYAGSARASVAAPYDPVAQVLRQCLRRSPALADAGPLTPYLAPLLPELGPAAPDAGEATLVEALLRAFAAMGSRGPVAVMLDDLHWADEATLLLLPQLAAGLREVPLLFVAIARDEVPADTHRLRRLRAQLRRVCEPAELPLRPFEREDTARLAAAVACEQLDDDIVAALHERAHGIPFYVEQLAATLALDGRSAEAADRLPLPETVLDAVLLRTEALSLAARNALELAAVAEGCDVEQIPGVPAGDALAEALASGFLVEAGPGRLAFRHALVREAVYAAIPWTRRRALHAAAARALEDRGASAAERATHWLGAGDVEHARTALAEAAAVSESVYAYRDASKLYERALDLGGGSAPHRFELLERLAICAQLAGDLASSARAWREVIDGRRGRGEVERVAEAEDAIGRVLALRGSTERAVAAWSAAAGAYAVCGRHEDAARSRLAVADLLHLTGSLRPALAAAEAALADLPPTAPPELRSRARAREGVLLGKLGNTAKALDSVHAALSEALTSGHPATAAAAYQAVAIVHENAGEFGKASEAYEVAIDYCADTGVAATEAVCSACLCHVLRQRGEWRRSLELSRALLDDPAVGPGTRAIAAAVTSQIHASRGERRPARLRVLEAAPVVREMRIFGAEMECSWTLARLELLEGSHETALEHCRDILLRWEESEDRHYSLNSLAWSARLFAANRQAEDLNRVVRALAAIAQENGNREALAMLAGALGELAHEQGEADAAVEHFRRALDLHRDIELPHDRAELLVSAARAARAAGLEEQAREWLTDARLHARRLGARPLQAAAERQLAELGDADSAPGAAAGLTPRQLQVIRRVAEGRTNREIAAEFVLSVRTVDMHVRHSLIALGCRSRIDAARKASELGLLERV